MEIHGEIRPGWRNNVRDRHRKIVNQWRKIKSSIVFKNKNFRWRISNVAKNYKFLVAYIYLPQKLNITWNDISKKKKKVGFCNIFLTHYYKSTFTNENCTCYSNIVSKKDFSCVNTFYLLKRFVLCIFNEKFQIYRWSHKLSLFLVFHSFFFFLYLSSYY